MDFRFKYILTALLVVSMLTSCKKGWLDVTSTSQIKAEEQFKAEAGFKDALMGVYISMTNPALYSKELTWNLVDLLSQQYLTLNASAFYADVQQYRYRTIRSTPQVDTIWNTAYKAIANINAALDQIDLNKDALSPVSYSIIKGEFLGLRAYLHFDLLRLYGYGNIANRPAMAEKLAIPYVMHFSKEVAPQLSYTKTFELLQADINASIELLKEDPAYKATGRPADYYSVINRDGFYNKREQRLNYYAVKALQARSLLWQGGTVNLAKAAAAAEEVISGSSAKLFNPATGSVTDRLLYTEHIFSLNINAFENIINTYLNAQDLASNNVLVIERTTAQNLYETSNANIGVPDIRFNRLLETQNKGMVPVRLYQRNDGLKNFMPMLAMPEMYYIAVENYITTNLPKAIEYLNKVRTSRGIVDQLSSASTATVVTDELFKEYRKEFISQGQLFFFYKRLGKTTFPGLPTSIVAGDNIYLLPYPASEIEFGNRVQ